MLELKIFGTPLVIPTAIFTREKPMNNILRLLSICIFTLTAGTAHSQEVYNFYFNKNNTPASLNLQQAGGSAGQATAAPIQPPMAPDATVTNTQAAASATSTAVAPVAKVVDKTAWDFEVGLGYFNASSYGSRGYSTYDSSIGYYDSSYISNEYYAGGWGLVGSMRLNKYISVDGAFASLKVDEMYGGGDQFLYLSSGVTITPLRLNVFGHDLVELGLIAGMMTNQSYTFEENESNNYEYEKVDEVVTVDPYIGLKVAFNLTNKLAIAFEGKSSKRDDFTSSAGTSTLRYKF